MINTNVNTNSRWDETVRSSILRPDSIDNNEFQDDTNRFNKFQKLQPVQETMQDWRNTQMDWYRRLDEVARYSSMMNEFIDDHNIQHTYSPRYPNIKVVSISILFCFAFLVFIFCIGICVEKCWSKCHKKKLKTVEKLDNVYSNTSPLIGLLNNNKC